MSKRRQQQADTFRALGSVGSVGMAFVLALVIGFWIGHVLDGWLHTSPWLTILFFFLGVAAGIVNLYRTMAEASGSGTKNEERRTNNEE
ncbi:MAG TPA: AtpZ/AtpI family protein [Vicinamibacterales bacterium]|jgi:ATP synthase protein I